MLHKSPESLYGTCNPVLIRGHAPVLAGFVNLSLPSANPTGRQTLALSKNGPFLLNQSPAPFASRSSCRQHRALETREEGEEEKEEPSLHFRTCTGIAKLIGGRGWDTAIHKYKTIARDQGRIPGSHDCKTGEGKGDTPSLQRLHRGGRYGEGGLSEGGKMPTAGKFKNNREIPPRQEETCNKT